MSEQIVTVPILMTNRAATAILEVGTIPQAFVIEFTFHAPAGYNMRGERTRPTVAIVKTQQGVSFGRADCAPVDTFNVTTGRKIALVRALGCYPKHIRQEIFDQLFACGFFVKGE